MRRGYRDSLVTAMVPEGLWVWGAGTEDGEGLRLALMDTGWDNTRGCQRLGGVGTTNYLHYDLTFINRSII